MGGDGDAAVSAIGPSNTTRTAVMATQVVYQKRPSTSKVCRGIEEMR